MLPQWVPISPKPIMIQQICRVLGFSVFLSTQELLNRLLLEFVLCLPRSGTEIYTSIYEGYIGIMEKKTILGLN